MQVNDIRIQDNRFPKFRKPLAIIKFAFCILLLLPHTADAHKITVFAWTEGDMVHVESKFSGGKKVRGGEVIVYDSDENQVITGKTDDQGEFSFKIVKKTAMKIVVIAGMGHQGEWAIMADEIEGAKVVEKDTNFPSSAVSDESPPEKTESAPSASLSADDIRLIMEASLDKKLKPVIKMLATSQQDHGPSVKDIFGGIGYIFGLMGVASYFHYRKKK
ncbi:hypothetical protein QUF80_04175 [Desulfococcaceae bacterium HSG8]|nr:hypothetical protein [Desulfococcaceae bacterium HSG8]